MPAIQFIHIINSYRDSLCDSVIECHWIVTHI